MKTNEKIQKLITDWMTNPRWKGVKRPYTAEEVVKFQDLNVIEKRKSINSLVKFYNQNYTEKFSAFTDYKSVELLIESGCHRIIVKDDTNSKKEIINNLIDARFTADVNDNSSIIIAKIYANTKFSIRDKVSNNFLNGSNNLKKKIKRSLRIAPYADVICLESSVLDLEKARAFAKEFKSKCPEKNLAFSCPLLVGGSFDVDKVKDRLVGMGYKFLLNDTADRIEYNSDEIYSNAV